MPVKADRTILGLVYLMAVTAVVSHSAAAIALGLLCLALPFGKDARRFDPTLMVPALLLGVVLLWSTLTTLAHGLPVTFLKKYYYYLPVIVIPLIRVAPRDARNMFVVSASVSAAAICFCFLLATFGEVPPALSRIYWDDRLAAFLSHPISAAGVFSSLALISISLIYRMDLERRYRIVLAVVTLVNTFGLILTQSRSFYLAYPFVLLLMIIHSRNRRMLVAAAAVVAAVLVYLGYNIETFQRILTVFDLENFQSNYERLAMWQVALKANTESWTNFLFGLGYGGWRIGAADYFARHLPEMQEVARYKHVHNILLNTLLETGLVGLLCYVGFIGSILAGLVRIMKKNGADPFVHAYAYGAFMAMICYQVAGAVDYLHMPDILLPTYFFVTLAFAIDSPATGGTPSEAAGSTPPA